MAQYILSDYVEQAMIQAVYDKLEDGTFAGRIPLCKGVIAFGNTLSLFSTPIEILLTDM